jgi:hypothetical protein
MPSLIRMNRGEKRRSMRGVCRTMGNVERFSRRSDMVGQFGTPPFSGCENQTIYLLPKDALFGSQVSFFPFPSHCERRGLLAPQTETTLLLVGKEREHSATTVVAER